ncbi:hypothetical protein IAQ61_002820 [Plenodomus lingam]|uniref:uncharacterized protein n=1 Tax=Leptosphaeria maculans TaxID=5022 RepID=UPI00332A5731|nr:hypothetical protein IAQ61_002820 [Plenodomus lingam]
MQKRDGAWDAGRGSLVTPVSALPTMYCFSSARHLSGAKGANSIPKHSASPTPIHHRSTGSLAADGHILLSASRPRATTRRGQDKALSRLNSHSVTCELRRHAHGFSTVRPPVAHALQQPPNASELSNTSTPHLQQETKRHTHSAVQPLQHPAIHE